METEKGREEEIGRGRRRSKVKRWDMLNRRVKRKFNDNKKEKI